MKQHIKKWTMLACSLLCFLLLANTANAQEKVSQNPVLAGKDLKPVVKKMAIGLWNHQNLSQNQKDLVKKYGVPVLNNASNYSYKDFATYSKNLEMWIGNSTEDAMAFSKSVKGLEEEKSGPSAKQIVDFTDKFGKIMATADLTPELSKLCESLRLPVSDCGMDDLTCQESYKNSFLMWAVNNPYSIEKFVKEARSIKASN